MQRLIIFFRFLFTTAMLGCATVERMIQSYANNTITFVSCCANVLCSFGFHWRDFFGASWLFWL